MTLDDVEMADAFANLDFCDSCNPESKRSILHLLKNKYNENQRLQLLELIEANLTTMTPAVADQLFDVAVVEALLEQVGESCEKDTLLISSILHKISSLVSSTKFIHCCCSSFTACLSKSGNSAAKSAVLSLLSTCCTIGTAKNQSRTESDIGGVLREISAGGAPLMTAIVNCLTDEDVTVGQGACNLILIIAKLPSGPVMLFCSQEVCNTFKSVAKHNSSIYKFRMFDLFVRFFPVSPDCASELISLGIGELLIAELNTRDVLSQLNALELLTRLHNETVSGRTFVAHHHITETLYRMFVEVKQSPDVGFLFPALLRYFGHFTAHDAKKSLQDYPDFMNTLFHMGINWTDLDMSMRKLVFETFAAISSVPGGKRLLLKQESAMKMLLPCWGLACLNGPIELRCRHLEAFASLIDSDCLIADGVEDCEALILAMQSWFISFHPSPCKILMEIFKQPFSNTLMASGMIFKNLAKVTWGAKTLYDHPGFMELLLDRSTAHDMDGRYIKYEIVEQLLKLPNLSELVTSADILRLKEYRQRGAYYVKAQAEVALDEG